MSGWFRRMFSPSSDRSQEPPAQLTDEELRVLRAQLRARIIGDVDRNMDLSDATAVRETLRRLFDQNLQRQRVVLTDEDADRLFEELVADIVGFGPIQPMLQDGSVTRITVIGADRVYAETSGSPVLTDVQFEGITHVRRIVDKIAYTYGRQATGGTVFRGELPDGSSFSALTPPSALGGPVLVIDKLPRAEPVVTAELIQLGPFTPELLAFLRDRSDTPVAANA